MNEEEEVEQLREMFKKDGKKKKKKPMSSSRSPLPPWNDSPMRPAPWALRGLKTNREPWAEDAAVYNKKFGNLHDAHFGPSNQASAAHMLGRNLREIPKQDGTTWDPSTFRNAPWPLRGLKPVTREPWFHDAAIYNAKFIDDPLEAAGSSGIMDDGAYLDGTFGYTDKVRYDKDGTALTTREEQLHKNWDSTTWRYTPHVLKGIRPITREPWARDEAVYNESRNSVDTRDSHEAPPDALTFKEDSSWNASPVPHPGRPYAA